MLSLCVFMEVWSVGEDLDPGSTLNGAQAGAEGQKFGPLEWVASTPPPEAGGHSGSSGAQGEMC